MSQNTEHSTTLEPRNTLGWHLRPVGLLVGVASMFESDIVVKCGRQIASAKSMLGLLTLAVGNDARFYVSARGRDAKKAIKAIRDKFSSHQDDEMKAYAIPPPSGGAGSDDGKSHKDLTQAKDSPLATNKSPPQGRVATTFTWYGKSDATKVFLAGDFNGWDPQAEPMTKRRGQFSKCLKLAPGEYQYKFIVDGEWHTDPAAPSTLSALGSINNVITV